MFEKFFAFQQRNGTKSEIPRVKYQNLESEWQKSDKIERILWLGNKVRKSRDKVRKKWILKLAARAKKNPETF